MSTQRFIPNFLLSLSVKEYLKSIKIRQSYCPKFGGFLFLEHSVILLSTFVFHTSSALGWVACSRIFTHFSHSAVSQQRNHEFKNDMSENQGIKKIEIVPSSNTTSNGASISHIP